jgi:hypothetical protein
LVALAAAGAAGKTAPVAKAAAPAAKFTDAQVTEALLNVIKGTTDCPNPKASTVACIYKGGEKSCKPDKKNPGKEKCTDISPDECMQHTEVWAASLGRALKAKGGKYGGRRATYGKFKADDGVRGCHVDDVDSLVASGRLRPGMMIHTKAHWNEVEPYHVGDDAHHWVMYVGKQNNVARYADNIAFGKCTKTNPWSCTSSQAGYYGNMAGWTNAELYGLEPAGVDGVNYPPRLTAIHDPLEGQRDTATPTGDAACKNAAVKPANKKGDKPKKKFSATQIQSRTNAMKAAEKYKAKTASGFDNGATKIVANAKAAAKY